MFRFFSAVIAVLIALNGCDNSQNMMKPVIEDVLSEPTEDVLVDEMPSVIDTGIDFTPEVTVPELPEGFEPLESERVIHFASLDAIKADLYHYTHIAEDAASAYADNGVIQFFSDSVQFIEELCKPIIDPNAPAPETPRVYILFSDREQRQLFVDSLPDASPSSWHINQELVSVVNGQDVYFYLYLLPNWPDCNSN